MSLALNSQKRKILSQLNLRAKFNNRTVSKNVNISYLEAFKESIGFKEVLANNIKYDKHHNSKYPTINVINHIINALILGNSRFNGMDDLRKDEAYSSIMGESAPSEKVYRDLLLDFPKETAGQLRSGNTALLALQAHYEGPREVMANFDDTDTKELERIVKLLFE